VRRWCQDAADDPPANTNLSTNYSAVLDERVLGFAH
jgi:hypothetical protein